MFHFSTLINLTPHALTLRGQKDYILRPSGTVARVTSTLQGEQIGDADTNLDLTAGETGEGEGFYMALPVFGPDTEGKIEGLPPYSSTSTAGYIVSSMVGMTMRGQGIKRPDILVLGTGPNDGATREKGQIVAVTRLKLVNLPSAKAVRRVSRLDSPAELRLILNGAEEGTTVQVSDFDTNEEVELLRKLYPHLTFEANWFRR